MKILSESVKKLHSWSNGLGVYVTKEARKFGWEEGTHVKVSAVEDDGDEMIVIEKVDI